EGEINGAPRTLEFAKVRHGLDRVVVVSQHGAISLAAIRWLYGVGVPLLHLDRDGKLLASVAPTRLGDARLRRAQAAAPSNKAGVEVARMLITRKIRGQISNLTHLPAPTTQAPPP